MRRVDHIDDEMRGRVTYELDDGRFIQFSVQDVREHGLDALLSAHGVKIPKDRIPVFQDGQRIGSVHATFEPMSIKSKSFFYDVRPGDFTRTKDGWDASRQLGPGDLHAVPGFRWDDADKSKVMDRSAEQYHDALLLAITRKGPIA